MAIIGELLFYRSRGHTLDDMLRYAATDGLRDMIERLPASVFSRSDEEIASELATKAKVSPLQVDFEKAKPEVRETTVDVSRNFEYGFGGRIPGLEVTKSIPFKGDGQLWTLQPNPYDLNPPRGEVRGGQIRIGSTVPTAQADSAASYLDETISRIKQYLQRQEAQIARHNGELEQAALPYIRGRRSRVGVAADLLKKLGG